jgi:DNA-binding transcriptional ArsR family regulator
LFKCIYIEPMKKENNVPVCKIVIVNEKKVTIARKSLSDKKQILEMAEIFKLLGEPTRLKIILSLSENELCVCDLAAVVESSISAISHQLRLLKNARLVTYRKDGKMVYYTLNDKHIKKIINESLKHSKELF